MKPSSCIAFVPLLVLATCSQQDVQLDYLKIHSVIQSRFATTLVQTKAHNSKTVAEEEHFLVVLPAEAFITNFTMQIGDRTIVGDVKEKNEARAVHFTENITKLDIKICFLKGLRQSRKSRRVGRSRVPETSREWRLPNFDQLGAGRDCSLQPDLPGDPEARSWGVQTRAECATRSTGQRSVDQGGHPWTGPHQANSCKFPYRESCPNRFWIIFWQIPEYGNKISDMSNKLLQQVPSQGGVKIRQDADGEVSSAKLTYNRQLSGRGPLNGQFVVLYDLERNHSGKFVLNQRLPLEHLFLSISRWCSNSRRFFRSLFRTRRTRIGSWPQRNRFRAG